MTQPSRHTPLDNFHLPTNPQQFGEDIEFSAAGSHIFADNVEADFPAAANRQAKRAQFSIVQMGLNAIDGEPAEAKAAENSINPCVYGGDRQKPLSRTPWLALCIASSYTFDGDHGLLNQVDAGHRPREGVKWVVPPGYRQHLDFQDRFRVILARDQSRNTEMSIVRRKF